MAALVSAGVKLHDKGDYDDAIKKYDEALAIDKNDYNANYEKSFSCFMSKRLDECITISQFILDKLPDNPDKVNVYSNYGSALDDKGKNEKALDVYDKGIKLFPDNFILFFNKGLSLQRHGKPEEALLNYQYALKNKPLHAGSNYYTGVILQSSNKVPSLLATLVFLAIESEGERAKKAVERMDQIMYGNVKKDSGNRTTISISADLFNSGNKKKENDFSSVEMIMSLMFSIDDDKLQNADDAEKLSLKLQLLVNSLSENIKYGKGFYWKFYVPFFIALKDKDYMSTFAHIIFYSKNNETVNNWLKDNKDKIDEFYLWLENYKWDTNI